MHLERTRFPCISIPILFSVHTNVRIELSSSSRQSHKTLPPCAGGAYLGCSKITQHDLTRAAQPQRAVLLYAQRQRQPLEDDVELDDGDGFGAQVSTRLSCIVHSALSGLTQRLYSVHAGLQPWAGLAAGLGSTRRGDRPPLRHCLRVCA